MLAADELWVALWAKGHRSEFMDTLAGAVIGEKHNELLSSWANNITSYAGRCISFQPSTFVLSVFISPLVEQVGCGVGKLSVSDGRLGCLSVGQNYRRSVLTGGRVQSKTGVRRFCNSGYPTGTPPVNLCVSLRLNVAGNLLLTSCAQGVPCEKLR